MNHEDNVRALCKLLDIEWPPKEDDVAINSLSFLADKAWILCPGFDTNLNGRLFFQNEVPRSHSTAFLRKLGRPNKPEAILTRAQSYFAELWDSAEEVEGSIITPLKQATKVVVHWRE